ncbi:MAG TPA: HD domain-containing protein [Actinomycetota bacterium]|nr:HD domain-containing protein [Actinomycetota bacterium]
MAGRTVIRDSIWGDIELGERELALIDTDALQRLRRVRQLGFTHLVFPGAHHTRFEHSIGVFHTAGLALDRLAGIAAAPPIGDGDRAAFLAAALLHDIGHYPFSHAVEELEIDQVRRHTEIARDLIVEGELAEVVERSWGADPRRVAMLVAGPGPGDEVPSETDRLLRAVLDSGLDVDKLDYLVRDAHGANVPYGTVDVQRLIGALTVWRDPEGQPALAVDRKGVAALQSLVFAKHLMFSTVYWHHAARSAVAMLLRALQTALGAGALAPGDLERADDESLVSALGTANMPDLTRALAGRLRSRRLYKRAIELTIDHDRFEEIELLWFRPADRARLEDSWAAEVDGAPGDVLIDVPEPRRIAVDLPVIVGEDMVTDWDHASGLASDDLDRFQRWVRRIRVFASDRETADRVRTRERALLG